MSAIALSSIAFVCISGGVLIGMLLRSTLAEHHLSGDAKDVVRLGTGLIGTIAALVLGLLISSAKNSYDLQSAQIKQMTANIVLLDHFLAQYGPETGAARNLMRRGVVVLADRMWRQNSSEVEKAAPFEASAASDALYAKLQELSPQNDSQRQHEYRANALAVVHADGQFDPDAVPGGADLLAHHHLCDLQLVCLTQRRCHRVPVLLRAVRGYVNLPDPRVGPTVCRADANLERAAAKCPCGHQSMNYRVPARPRLGLRLMLKPDR